MTKDEIIKEIDKLGEDEKKEILEYLKKKKKPDNYKEAISTAFNTNGRKPKRFLLLSICSKGDYECAGECSASDLGWSYEEIRNNNEILEGFVDFGVDSELFDPDISNEEVLDMFLIDDLTNDTIKQILHSQGVDKCQYKKTDAIDLRNGEGSFLVWDNETKEVIEFNCWIC